jgi:hypothetical protein
LEYRHTDDAGNKSRVVTRTVKVVDPTVDSDGDDVPDYTEYQEGTDPDDPNDFKDTDKDGVPDHVEAKEGTDPADETDIKDDNNNGIPDYVETHDFIAPVVTLSGSSIIRLLIGQTYIDPGFTRTDNLDGSGTETAASSGTVNTNTP